MAPDNPDEIESDFSRQVRKRREALDLNQTEVGTLAGVHRATIRALEIGRTVEGKTLTNVLRALGCSATMVLRTAPARIEMIPVFTVGTAKMVAHAIVSGLAAHGTDDAEEPHQPTNLIADWYDLVDAASLAREGGTRALPDSFDRLRDGLPLTASQLRSFDWELAMIFGASYPYQPDAEQPADARPGTARAVKVARIGTAIEANSARHEIRPGTARRDPEVDMILTSGLSQAVQNLLILWLGERRQQLTEELASLIDLSATAAEQGRGGDGGHGQEDS